MNRQKSNLRSKVFIKRRWAPKEIIQFYDISTILRPDCVLTLQTMPPPPFVYHTKCIVLNTIHDLFYDDDKNSPTKSSKVYEL